MQQNQKEQLIFMTEKQLHKKYTPLLKNATITNEQFDRVCAWHKEHTIHNTNASIKNPISGQEIVDAVLTTFGGAVIGDYTYDTESKS